MSTSIGNPAGKTISVSESILQTILDRLGGLEQGQAVINNKLEQWEQRSQQQITGTGDAAAADGATADTDAWYFGHYASGQVHELMLKDRVRTGTYQRAIFNSRSHIEGKIVLDVGCGSGILSVFAAQCKAQHVFAIDASAIAETAVAVVKANRLEDRVSVLASRVEDLPQLPVVDQKLPPGTPQLVDTIVSEWMGFSLLTEAMLASVIEARDRFLRPGGLMLPSHSALVIAPVEDASVTSYWNHPYGVALDPLRPLGTQRALNSPYPAVEPVPPEALLGPGKSCMFFDLYSVKAVDVGALVAGHPYTSTVALNVTRAGPLHGFCIWFDCWFDPHRRAGLTEVQLNKEASDVAVTEASSMAGLYDAASKAMLNDSSSGVVRLKTGPAVAPDRHTHWMQSLLLSNSNAVVAVGDVVTVTITIVPSCSVARYTDMELVWAINGVPTGCVCSALAICSALTVCGPQLWNLYVSRLVVILFFVYLSIHIEGNARGMARLLI